MKFAILAPGHIAQSMAKAVASIEKIERYAVASREYARAEAFAKEWGFERAYGSYEEMLRDPQVELVYVASPHSHHYRHAKMCLEHGKHVLVEKAFTVNAAQAGELIRISRQRGLLLAEAMWTRYMPSRRMIDDLIEGGAIGEVRSLTANLGFPMLHKERLREPALAGGALLDVGIYPVTFALTVFHGEVSGIDSTAVMSPEGVDWIDSISLTFEDGRLAVLNSSMVGHMDCKGIVHGSSGYLEVLGINNCSEIRVFNGKHEMTASYKVPEQINGYEYEVLSVLRAIEEGQTECREMPHAETLRVMKLLDAIRAKWGMKFPCE